MEEITYRFNNGNKQRSSIKIGEVEIITWWFINGQKNFATIKIHGIKNGTFQGWSENSTRESIFQNKTDQIHGPKIMFNYGMRKDIL